MKVVRSAVDVRHAVAAVRASGRVGFVPTMGALHEGHLSLIRHARSACEVIVLSIFVNPLQFGPNEDLERYPRPEERDLELAEGEGVDIAFLPSVEEMYPAGAATTVAVGELGAILEGAHRPGHFDGVATVVAKLFNIVDPDVAFFGQKDAQQVAVLKRMVADLDLGIDIVVGETVREPDGLAMSSRNVYLSADERERALSLNRALQAGAETLQAGESPEDAERRMRAVLEQAGAEIDYAVVVDPDTFGPPDGTDTLLLVAARVGGTRLIDNLLLQMPDRGTG